MQDFIVIGIIVILVGIAGYYIWKQKKKKGVHCIGCPYAGTCSSGACSQSSSKKK